MLVLTAWLSGCQRQEKQAGPVSSSNDDVVAEVNGTAISTDMVVTELRRRLPNANVQSVTSAQKEVALDALIQREALYVKALKAGFDQAPEIKERIKDLVVARFQEQQFTAPEVTITDAEVEAVYTAEKQRFARPVTARGGIIFISCPATATEASRSTLRDRARAIAVQATVNAETNAFDQLVARYSEHQPSRYRGGDTGWVMANSEAWEAPVRDALLALREPGQFAPLIETPRGFYVLKLLERREASWQPIAEVRELLRHELARKKVQDAEHAFQAQVKSGLEIRIHQERIQSIELPPLESHPPSLPGVKTAQINSESRP